MNDALFGGWGKLKGTLTEVAQQAIELTKDTGDGTESTPGTTDQFKEYPIKCPLFMFFITLLQPKYPIFDFPTFQNFCNN